MIIIEGFKMVGKSTLINSLDSSKYILPRCGVYDFLGMRDSRYGLSYSDAWVICGVLSLYKLDKQIIVDRGVLSTLIYNKEKEEVVLNEIVPLLESSNSEVWVLSHKSKHHAEMKFNKRKEENRGIDPHSDFIDFEDYWSKYLEYQKKQDEQIKKLKNIKVLYLEV